MIVYTSGTTGRPKGVVSTHGNIAAQIASLVQAWEWQPSDVTLLVLPLHHVHGIINVVGCALAAGAACEILPQFDVDDRLGSHRVGRDHGLHGGPDDLSAPDRRLGTGASRNPAKAARPGVARARLMMSGSAALAPAVLERWREITGHTLLERYGMTEFGMALANPLRGPRRPGTSEYRSLALRSAGRARADAGG